MDVIVTFFYFKFLQILQFVMVNLFDRDDHAVKI